MVGKIYSRTSMAMTRVEGAIDIGYQGIIYVELHNHSDCDYEINVRDRIA